MGCDNEMYYDPGTNSCAYCSELCYLVDIQGTRDECLKRCPGFLDQEVTNAPLPLQGTTIFVTPEQPYTPNVTLITVIVVICAVFVAAIVTLLYKNRETLLKRLKRQECCTDGMSSQPHVQESGNNTPQDGLLVNQGYPDLPNVSISCSIITEETRC